MKPSTVIRQVEYTLFLIISVSANSSADRCFKQPNKDSLSELQDDYIKVWKSVHGEGHTAFEPSIEGALNLAKQIGDENGGMKTLITGSLYLIGGALRLLEPARPKVA